MQGQKNATKKKSKETDEARMKVRKEGLIDSNQIKGVDNQVKHSGIRQNPAS